VAGEEEERSVPDRDVSSHTEIFRVEDLVRRRVVEDRLCVDTGLVGEGAPTGDVVVEGDLDLDGLGDQVLDLSEHAQVVLGLDGLGVGSVHSGDETTERGDTVSLSDTELDALDEERERVRVT
jgi:hypothetical protein